MPQPDRLRPDLPRPDSRRPDSERPDPRRPDSLQSGRPGPRRAVTGRALVLGVLVVLLVVVLASPLSRYVGSRGDVGAAAQQLQQDQQQLHDLQARLQQLSDPGYIQQQARTRLQWAMPGDTVYVVVGQGQKSGIVKTANAPAANSGPTWNQRLWSSVQAAGANSAARPAK